MTILLITSAHAEEPTTIPEAPVPAAEVQDHALPGGLTDEERSTGFAASLNKSDAPFDIAPYAQQIKAVEEYLSSFSTLESRFSQTTDEAAVIVQGTLQISRPGKMRLEYTRPNQLEIIVNGRSMRYYDVGLDEVTYGNIPDTPFEVLLYHDVKFSGGSTVTKVLEDEVSLSITIRPSDENIRKNSFAAMTLVFMKNPITLKRIVRTNDINHSTSIYLLDTVLDAPLDDGLFNLKNPTKKKKKN